MFSLRSLMLLIPALSAIVLPASALPAASRQVRSIETRQTSSSDSGFWVGSISSKDTVWQNPSTSYAVFRNVMDYGAKGDGTTDDTAAINKAMADGNRCGQGCNSSTIQPAIIYFPAGKYSVSSPIQMYYYTQMIGEIGAGNTLPSIVPTSNFQGAMGVFDSDPYYVNSGANWWINQNNFFRQVRNFEFDLTHAPTGQAAIHWQVAQATSLQNIVFNMIPNSQQTGINMDNGSGGFFGNLTFNGGMYGAKLGNQQFTTRDLTFNGCQTAIYMNWNWGWTFNNVNIQNCDTGLDISASPTNQTVGSVVLSDSVISNTKNGIRTAWESSGNVPANGNTLILDNVNMSQAVENTVVGNNNATVKAALEVTHFDSWVQGSSYDHTASKSFAQNSMQTGPVKAASLLDNGNIFGRIRPQYEDVPVTQFLTAKAEGCHGDGENDDTTAVQAFLNKAAQQKKVAYFDHGAYLISDTITVPNNVRITGSAWPLILAKGSSFNDVNNPKAVFSVGTSQGSAASNGVEISDLVFETLGPAPGAVMIEWNLESDQGASGVWDTHVRIGGSAGTQLQAEQCPGFPTTKVSESCYGVFLMFHATPQSAGVYLENTWFWVADHDLDNGNQTQTSIYSGRGVLIQSQNGPVWMWGTASEHSLFYNYQIDGAKAVFGGFMQSETPYYQPFPAAPEPFTPVSAGYNDPTFSNANSVSGVPSADAWGLRVLNSSEILLYGTGMYSFFQDYSQSCVGSNNCQEYMIQIENSQIDMYAVTTKAAVNMIVDSAYPNSPVLDSANRDTFGATVAYYSTGNGNSGGSDGNTTTTTPPSSGGNGGTGSAPSSSSSSGPPSGTSIPTYPSGTTGSGSSPASSSSPSAPAGTQVVPNEPSTPSTPSTGSGSNASPNAVPSASSAPTSVPVSTPSAAVPANPASSSTSSTMGATPGTVGSGSGAVAGNTVTLGSTGNTQTTANDATSSPASPSSGTTTMTTGDDGC